jgi:hypothetical protein
MDEHITVRIDVKIQNFGDYDSHYLLVVGPQPQQVEPFEPILLPPTTNSDVGSAVSAPHVIKRYSPESVMSRQ